MKKLFVLFAAAGLLVAFAGSAIAADWGFYGSMRFQTFWESDSKDVQGTFSDDDLTWEYMSSGTTRIGANVKAGDIGGRFEYGLSPRATIFLPGYCTEHGTLVPANSWSARIIRRFTKVSVSGPGGMVL